MKKLIFGNCLDEMKNLEPNSIDMILCDLPYGTTSCLWDIIIPFDELWKCYKYVMKNNTPIVLFGIEPFSSHLRLSNLEMFKYDWYWEKERATNIMQMKRRAGKTIETISVFYNEQCLYNPQMIKHDGPLRSNKIKNGKLGSLVDSNKNKPNEYVDSGYRYPTQNLKFKRDILTSNLHPTQKPVALLEYLIKTYTKEGDLVLDNCMGSGSTGEACLNTNRDFIGIENDKTYFDIAYKRLNKKSLGEMIC
jgi:DNA modification methylase